MCFVFKYKKVKFMFNNSEILIQNPRSVSLLKNDNDVTQCRMNCVNVKHRLETRRIKIKNFRFESFPVL